MNTGWTAGPYGSGHRMPIGVSREIVNQIISGELSKKSYERHSYTGLMVPKNCSKDISEYIFPENTWDDKERYRDQAEKLMTLFSEKKKELCL